MGDTSLAAGDTRTFLPDEDPGNQAAIVDLVAELHRRGRPVADRPALLTGPDGSPRLPLPLPVYDALLKVAEALSQGLAVTVAPQHTTLSTYQAAELLGISRPTFVKLLESREIPYERATDRPGAHRRVKLRDVLIYQEKRRVERRRILDELTQESIEAGTYDKPSDDS
ncbi:excisionase family DNA-binding protein [Herbidospora sp. NEAU-GS84]|uniref:Excisionase family DNA-binding protein n=1 Tax=Herbidospora solisilvae TaxID=2696284 RepID=A0A7C9JD78_9ACTN|nr:excisionase family DNA-binding protein [Herbidospora solisilvae]NAS23481.1 excisionase family DNA-binding protein [Herbidospora solisilvae]